MYETPPAEGPKLAGLGHAVVFRTLPAVGPITVGLGHTVVFGTLPAEDPMGSLSIGRVIVWVRVLLEVDLIDGTNKVLPTDTTVSVVEVSIAQDTTGSEESKKESFPVRILQGELPYDSDKDKGMSESMTNKVRGNSRNTQKL